MFIPQSFTLKAYRGATFSQQVNFWNDDAHTQAFDFTPWNVAVTISPPAATSGAAIPNVAVNISGGAMIFSMIPADTAAVPAVTYNVLITLTAKAGIPPEVEYLAVGTFSFIDPS